MAKFKDIKYDIGGREVVVPVHVNKDGIFTAKLPREILNMDRSLRSEMSEGTFRQIELNLLKIITKYKNSTVTQDLFLAVRYGSCGNYCKSAKGSESYFLFRGPLDKKYQISLSFDSGSAIMFDFEIIIRETRDAEVTYYKSEIATGDNEYWDSSLMEKVFAKKGDIIKRDRYSGYSMEKATLIPYTKEALENLTHIQEQLRIISETLFNLVENTELSNLLNSGNLKLLNQ